MLHNNKKTFLTQQMLIQNDTLVQEITTEQQACKIITEEVFKFEIQKHPSLTAASFPKHIGFTEKANSTAFSELRSGALGFNKNKKQKLIEFIDKNNDLKNKLENEFSNELGLVKKNINITTYLTTQPTPSNPTYYTDEDLSDENLQRDRIVRPIVNLILKDLNCKPVVLDQMLSKYGTQTRLTSQFIRKRRHAKSEKPCLFPKTKYQALLNILTDQSWHNADDERKKHYQNLKSLINPLTTNNLIAQQIINRNEGPVYTHKITTDTLESVQAAGLTLPWQVSQTIWTSTHSPHKRAAELGSTDLEASSRANKKPNQTASDEFSSLVTKFLNYEQSSLQTSQSRNLLFSQSTQSNQTNTSSEKIKTIDVSVTRKLNN